MKRFDLFQLGSIAVIISIGLIVIRSVGSELFPQQVIFTLISLSVYFFISRLDYRTFANLFFPLYITILVFLISPFIFGIVSRGSLRWIQLGPIFIQPSEVVRPLLILSFASLVCKFPRPLSLRNLGLIGLLTAPILGLVMLQPDLGSALVLSAGILGITLAGGLRIKYIFTGFLLALIVLPLGINRLHGYQKDRLMSFVNPYSDPLGKGYNSIQAVISVGSGGIWGRGLGHGTQSHLKFLPENHTDFIFASLTEELGLVGATILIAAYLVLLMRIYLSGIRSTDRFAVLVSLGILSMLSFQTLVNISMNIGLAPVTGVTLPLVSYGGSSLLGSLFLLGLVQNIYSFRVSSPATFTIK